MVVRPADYRLMWVRFLHQVLILKVELQQGGNALRKFATGEGNEWERVNTLA